MTTRPDDGDEPTQAHDIARKTGSARVLGPGSVTWKYAGDNVGGLLSGSVLILQVAHPVVGAGVEQFSTYKTDPWGRLDRTTRHVTSFIYGGPVAAPKSADELRALHRGIKGTDSRGRRYHAFDPEAYAWVHLTLLYAIMRAHELYATPLTHAERESFFEEWKVVGDLLGVRASEVPPTVDDFDAYIERMIEERLEDNETVRHLLGPGLHRVGRPAFLTMIPKRVWRAMYAPVGRLLYVLTLGGMPASLREKLALAWTARDERLFRLVRAGIRTSTRYLPQRLRYNPLAWHAMQKSKEWAPLIQAS